MPKHSLIITVYKEPKVSYWPIVLKNSVLAVNEKILGPQADLVNLGT
jgi:hypothetical protein